MEEASLEGLQDRPSPSCLLPGMLRSSSLAAHIVPAVVAHSDTCEGPVWVLMTKAHGPVPLLGTRGVL